jgi:hypothetical protein
VYVKSVLTGFLCACLAGGYCAAQTGAPPQPAPSAPESQAPQPPPDQSDPSQTQEAGSPVLTIPELPKIPDLRMPGEKGISLGVSAWFTNQQPELRKGTFAYTYPGNIGFQGKPKVDQGADFAVAVGKHNVLRASFFRSSAAGNTVAPTDLGIITQYYLKGDQLATNYRLTSLKLSFEYLTWPYPVKNSRFRLKSLWEVEYTQVRVGFDAPLVATTDSLGNPLTDASGNLLSYSTSAKYRYYLPEIGLKAQYYVRPGLRLEASAAGFDIPHHANTWDAEATANVRFGHYELQLGLRGHHYRTSPQQDFWVRGNMMGPFVGLRLYSDQGPQ